MTVRLNNAENGLLIAGNAEDFRRVQEEVVRVHRGDTPGEDGPDDDLTGAGMSMNM